MNRSIIAGVALATGIAIAAPTMLARSADNPQQTAPAQQGMGAMHPMPGMMGAEGMGAMAQQRPWMRMMHGMMRLTPQQRCDERLARRAGIVAYTIAKVNLTQQQQPAWDKLRGAMQQAAARQRALCATLKSAGPGGQETMLDRVKRREEFLSARLDGLKQIRPALEEFYAALTPQQKAVMDHPFRPL